MSVVEDSAFIVRAWHPGQAPTVIGQGDIAGQLEAKVPVWVDVTSINDPFLISQQLSPHLSDLSPALIAELINPTALVRDHGSLRLVRAAHFAAPTVYPGTERPRLLIAGLHIMRGPGWLATFRAPAWEAAGGGDAAGRLTVEALINAARPHWNTTDMTVDDLATQWLLELARSARTSATNLGRYMRNADLARWERSGSAPDQDDLRALAFRIDTLALHLRGLQQPGTRTEEAWFGPIAAAEAARAIDEIAESVADYLDGVRRDVRSAIDERRTEKAEEEVHRLELIVGAIASLFLGPTLIATVFGAFPGWFENHSSSRALALALVSLALAALTGLGLWLYTSKSGRSLSRRARCKWMLLATVVAAAIPTGIICQLHDPAPKPRPQGLTPGRAGSVHAPARLA